MPIVVKINPVRVEEVTIETNSPILEDVLLSVWPIVRRNLSKMNRELQEFSVRFLVHQTVEELREKKRLGDGKAGD